MSVEIDNKSDRAELKTYFARNAIPTEANFAALIDGVINQREDGVAKPVGSPLSLQATAQNRVLDLYQSFTQAAPSWSVGLSVPVRRTERKGLAVSDASGAPRLFLDEATGALGVGTTVPQDALDVGGSVRFNSNGNPIRITGEWSAFPDARTNGAEISNDTATHKTLMIVGNKSAGGERRVSVWDRLEVNGTLQVIGNLGIGTPKPADPLDVAGRVRVNSATNPLHFTSAWSNFPNATSAEISNDTGTYQTLMIIGNNSAGRGRRVSVWDRFEVNGSMTITGTIDLQDWRSVRYENGWERYASSWADASYYKDPFGIVHLQGLLKNGTNNSVAFTLPGGYRPTTTILSTTHSAPVPGSSIARPTCRIDVRTDGSVVVFADDLRWVSLFGVSFRTT